MAVKSGNATYIFSSCVSSALFSSSGGKEEMEGPLGKLFDEIYTDSLLGKSSWEKAESQMIENTVSNLLRKGRLKPSDIDAVLAGDLLNQSTASTYGLRKFSIPHLGIYGACSNIGEAMGLASLLIDGGAMKRVCAVTSSHFCTAERQFRSPLEYGGVKAPTAQWTATACGAVLLEKRDKPPYVRAFSIGSITDMGVKDIGNMGSAMAPDNKGHTPSVFIEKMPLLWYNFLWERSSPVGNLNRLF